MAETVKVEGLGEVLRNLQNLRKGTARGVVQRVLKRAAEPIANAARANAPVRTGQLRRAIIVTTKRPPGHKTAAARAFASAGGGAAGRAAAKAAGGSPVSVFLNVTRHAPHGWAVEVGTKHSRARRFLRRAFDDRKRPTVQTIGSDMMAEIRRTIARSARRRR